MVEDNERTYQGTRIVSSPLDAPVKGYGTTYQGAGFSGKRLGEPPPTQQLEPQTSVGRQASAPQAAPPEMHCLSCNSQAQWLPNGQLWCPACQTALEVQDHTKQAGAAVGGVILGIAMLLFALGAFDPILAEFFGFSVHECIGTYNFVGQLVGVDCSGPLGWSTGVNAP